MAYSHGKTHMAEPHGGTMVILQHTSILRQLSYIGLLCTHVTDARLTASSWVEHDLQGEIADRRATQNNFVRQLGDISRTLKSMGLHHQIQVSPVVAEPFRASQVESLLQSCTAVLRQLVLPEGGRLF